MRVFFGIVALCTTVAVLANFTGCGGESEPIHAVCKDFCESIVSAMDESDSYDISNVAEAEKNCMRECTDSIEGFKDDNLQDDVIDCLDCIGNEAGDNADEEDFWDAVNDDCYDECYDDDPEDPDPWDEFYSDFSEDFDEHFSWGDGGDSDIDMDTDMDTDTDTDTDCDYDAATVCYDEYSICADDCMDDTDCILACFDDYCICIEDANCNPSDFGC